MGLEDYVPTILGAPSGQAEAVRVSLDWNDFAELLASAALLGISFRCTSEMVRTDWLATAYPDLHTQARYRLPDSQPLVRLYRVVMWIDRGLP